MKKKLVSYLILACSVFGLAMVGSCKDYEDEFKGYRTEIDNLNTGSSILQDTIDSIKARLGRIKQCACDPTLRHDLDSLYDFLGDIAHDSTGLATGYAGGLSYVLNNMNQQIANAAAKAYSDSVDSVLGKKIDDLKCLWPDSLYKAYVKSHLVHDSLRLISDSVRLYTDSVRLFRDSVAIDSIIKKLAELSEEHAKFVDSITLADSIKVVEKRYKKADSIIMDTLRIVSRRLDAIADSVNELWKIVDTLKLRVDTLENQVDSLMDAEKKRITSLYVNGTKNPVYGSFALPFGISSNVLMAYYGNMASSIDFPTRDASMLVKGSDNITAKDEQVLTSFETALAGGTILTDAADNAGKLFFTVNPNDVKLDSTYSFALINSVGDTCKVELDSIRKSKEKLSFGFSSYSARRGQVVEDDINTEYGFYEASVRVKNDSETLSSLSPNISKSVLKNALLNSKNDAGDLDFRGMTQTILQELDGVIDANALSVTWTDSMGKHNVKSDYSVAVAAIQPLSYHAFTELSVPVSLDLPKNPVQELLNSIKEPKITMTFTPITIGTVTFKIDNVTYTFGAATPDMVVTVTDNDNNPIGKATVSTTDLENNMKTEITHIVDTMNVAFDSVEARVNRIVAHIQSEIQDQVNDMLGSFEGQIKSNISNIVGDIKTQIGSNTFVKRLESLISRVNNISNIIDNLGYEFVEPAVMYSDAEGAVHYMSAIKEYPSSFNGTGEYSLYLTSMSNEILVPAYKKYIAVTNFKDASTGKDFQNDDDAASKSVITSINGTGDFGVVLEGNVKEVSFNPSQKGVYEILLSTVDYDGYICNNKFYVNVK